MKDGINYDVEIYQQGSFALGTLIRPISDEDDYDLDVLCEMKDDYNLDARTLKCDIVLSWLNSYRATKLIEDKPRCWHVEYEDMPHFHMDVIPSVNGTEASQPIKITERINDSDYRYILSNPYGYRNWFRSLCKAQEERMKTTIEKQVKILVEAGVEVEHLKQHRIKVPLQRSIQLLKRHRDIMFSKADIPDDIKKGKPISIIITTLVAECCNESDSILEIISSFPQKAITYIEQARTSGKYHVNNPAYSGENFADKWNIDISRKEIFYAWLKQVSIDFNKEKLQNMNRDGMYAEIKRLFGENIGIQVIQEMLLRDNEAIKQGKKSFDPNTGMISADGVISIPSNHHYHH